MKDAEISPHKRKRLPTFLLIAFIYAGNDLLSHTLSRAVQSALRGLTSVFGMGTGVSPAVRSPTTGAVSYQLSAISNSVLRRPSGLMPGKPFCTPQKAGPSLRSG